MSFRLSSNLDRSASSLDVGIESHSDGYFRRPAHATHLRIARRALDVGI